MTIDNKIFVDLSDEQTKNPAHWYKFYFYYTEENQIIYTWTRSFEKGKTKFAFVSVNDGLKLVNWRDINHDFNRSENKEQKRKFEERILKKIEEILRKGSN